MMAEAAMTITFKIHDNTATGTVVYEESHTTTTNTQGLISLNVGNGVAVLGTFSGVNWGSGHKFLHVLMNAGSGVVDLGTQQMMSVPYAMYAEDVPVRVSVIGDSLFIGNQVSIVPGVSAANPISISNYGSLLLPGNTTCQNEYISVTGCGGQDSLLYYDRYYSLAEIGGQCWFAENLATDKYANGDNIPTGLTNTQWLSTTAGAYAVYNNDLANDAIYGKLYNWYTTVDTRGVCPTGWHVPSDCEWNYMQVVLEPGTTGSQDCFCGFQLMSLTLWSTTNATNSSGLSLVPSGQHLFGSPFEGLGYSAFLWTSSELNNFGLGRDIVFQAEDILGKNVHQKYTGFAIRCIKD
jgi:uncharacterized protein (TIGR02145 family)